MASVCVSVCPRTCTVSEGRFWFKWSSWCPCLWGHIGEGFCFLPFFFWFIYLFLFSGQKLLVSDFAIGSLARYQIFLGDIFSTPVYLPRPEFSLNSVQMARIKDQCKNFSTMCKAVKNFVKEMVNNTVQQKPSRGQPGWAETDAARSCALRLAQQTLCRR